MFVPCIEWCRVSSFIRWPFTPHPQGHRIFWHYSYFFLFDTPVPTQRSGLALFFPKPARWPGCAIRRSGNLVYSCFSLSKRRRGHSTPPPLFLLFDLPSLSAIRYPLCAIRTPHDARRKLSALRYPLYAIFNFNQTRMVLLSKIRKNKIFYNLPYSLFSNNLSLLCVLAFLCGQHFFQLKCASPPNI